MDPGPIDGVMGPKTQATSWRSRSNKGLLGENGFTSGNGLGLEGAPA